MGTFQDSLLSGLYTENVGESPAPTQPSLAIAQPPGTQQAGTQGKRFCFPLWLVLLSLMLEYCLDPQLCGGFYWMSAFCNLYCKHNLHCDMFAVCVRTGESCGVFRFHSYSLCLPFPRPQGRQPLQEL